MDAFLFAIGAVMPLILIVALGYLLKRVGLFPADLGRRVNKIVFKILIVVHLLQNPVRVGYASTTKYTFFITWGTMGLSARLVATLAMLSTVSIPSTTWPKAAY